MIRINNGSMYIFSEAIDDVIHQFVLTKQLNFIGLSVIHAENVDGVVHWVKVLGLGMICLSSTSAYVGGIRHSGV